MYVLSVSGVISAIALLSLLFLRKKFNPLELVTYWLFAASMKQLLYTLISLNLGFLKLKEGYAIFWAVKQMDLIVVPIVMIWFLAMFRSDTYSRLVNLFVVVIFGTSLIALDYFLWKPQLFHLINWGFLRTLLIYGLLYTYCLWFMYAFIALMRREFHNR